MVKNKFIKLAVIGFIGLFFSNTVSFAALNYQETYRSTTGVNKVLITVNSSIYDAIFSPYLRQYIADLEAEDYNVTLIKYISGTAQELKDYIKPITELKGVVFVGDMPNPMFEISNDYNQYGYQSFPIDLFYTDLDGVWQDTNSNGIYDTHTAGAGTLGPEIWLGRLTVAPIYSPTMDQVALLKNYFTKNHSYRIGAMPVVQRGLSYPDDDWASFMDSDLSYIYDLSNLTIVNDINLTTAVDYKAKLALDYEWVHVCAHSDSSLSAFYENNRASMGYVYNTSIMTIDPKAVFFNLFACSNAKYTAYNYMGGNYVFAKTKGLAAVGSTKIGSMLYFYNFYSPLGSGLTGRKNLGEAFKLWFRAMNLGDFTYKCWFYGMTLLGDPTLTLDPPIAVIDYINPTVVNEGQSVELRGSGKISNGSITAYSWRSNINGYLSGDSFFTATSLSAGTQTIYFKVQDNKGRWSSEVEKTIIVNAGVLPTLTFSANPLIIGVSGQSTLSWSSLNVNSCIASGAWSGNKSVNGEEVVMPVISSDYTLTCSGATGSVNQTVSVMVDNTAPSATITSPANGAVLTGSSTKISVTSTDDRSVKNVEFYKDNILLGADNTVPYELVWNIASENSGSHTLFAKAYDDVGNVGTSASVTVNIAGDTIAPQVSILSPANGSRISGKVTIKASATDNIAVTRLELFIDGALKTSVTTSSLTYSWNVSKGVSSGAHIITVKGYDAKGNIGTASITVIK